MTDFKTATTVGARIAALRKARGFASAKALAEAIPGDSVTESILQNIEAGRKNDLAVAQLLNIAWALRVSPVFILAPLGSPHAHVDLPNLAPDVQNLTVAEFDAWISGIDGAYHPMTADEHSERTQLEALRELLRARREARRLRSVLDLSVELAPSSASDETPATWANFQEQLDDTNRRIQQLQTFLESGGWNTSHPSAAS
jgi:transcriptional regulator with XRE-family HTH domain